MESNMRQHILKNPVPDLVALENEIQYRLKRGKTRLLIAHGLLFILTVSFILFAL